LAGYNADCLPLAGRLPQREVSVGEFKLFLKEYGVIGLALGVIIGSKAGELVTSIVDGLLMPIVGMLLPSGDWQKLVVGPFQVGIVLAALIKFIIVAYFVFFISKRLLREDKVAKK
jgi:large conductance mechanosensitive channel